VDELGLRLVLLANVVVPFVFFMAAVYLALHIVFARLVTSPASPLLWFFGVVTGPLIRPVRRFLAPARPERHVRLAALLVYVALWLASRAFFVWLSASRQG
jgi:hypothetical protein